MAVSSAQITVGTAAVPVTASEGDSVYGSSIVVTNTGSTAVLLGPAGVTTATGFTLAAGATTPRLELGNGERGDDRDGLHARGRRDDASP